MAGARWSNPRLARRVREWLPARRAIQLGEDRLNQITQMNTDKKEWAREHSRREWGRIKTKTLQAGLPDFCFFSANPRLLGSSVPIRAIRGLLIKFNARPLTLDPRPF